MGIVMWWWIWTTVIGIYVVGFGLTFYFHVEMAPNATMPLVLIRCVVWPVFWATGWPHGMTLPMD